MTDARKIMEQARASQRKAVNEMRRRIRVGSKSSRIVLTQQAAQPVAQGFNPAADCSPALTQCPRCNNPNGVPCDGGRASQPVAWTDDQMNRFVWTCSAPIHDAGSIMDRLRAFREYEATRGRAIPAEQPQQDELQQAKDRIDRLETEMRKLRGNLRGVFDRELWDSLDTQPQQAPCDPSCLVAAGGTQDDYCVLTLGECARKKASST